jgi:predicted ATPase/class 3 adenylate cyclase
LLFTDIEGSTKLWEADPPAMAAALRQHDRILRAAIEGAGGFVFKTVGDAFCAAFTTPRYATDAAVVAQRRLAAETWQTHRPILVRMAMHTGVCEERDNDYFGPAVNRAARLEAIAHGGQVLVSGTTAELLAGNDEVKLRDLGQHRLRDLGRPEQVYQLEAESLRPDFPDLDSLDNPELPNNLPSLLSGFVGRERELAEIRALVNSWRLVTLTGAGGCGKTRLALQSAAELLDSASDGVWFVELATVTDGNQVPAAVAACLGLPEPGQLMAALREYDAFLLLDNCEHVIDAAAVFCGQVGRDCPKVRLLATSREPLGIDGERVYRVASLSLPPPEAEDLTDFDAVRLFTERARAHDASFALDETSGPQVASICRRLDGIPLALELAAARLSSMSLVHLSQRLDQRFRLLTGGSRNVMPRQQTLQATVDWSFGLLTEPEREMLRRLSVFSGGFELEAVEAVCVTERIDVYEVANLLGSLVAKSLVIADRTPDSVRYRMLETIRQYAADELLRTDGDAEVLRTRERHAEFYIRLAEEPEAVRMGPHQGEWLRRVDLDWENLRLTFIHLESGQRVRDVFRLGVGLDRFIGSRGHVEALDWLRWAIETADPAPDPLLGRALCVYAGLTMSLLPYGAPDRNAGQQLAEQALAIARTLGDTQLEAEALNMLAGIVSLKPDSDDGRRMCEEALVIARRLGDSRLTADLLDTLSAYATSDDERHRISLEAWHLMRETGDVLLTTVFLGRLFWLDVTAGQLIEARGYIEQAIAAAEALGAEMLLFAFRTDLALLHLIEGDRENVVSMARGLLLTARRLGTGIGAGEVILAAACCAAWQDEGEKAARLFGAADAGLADLNPHGRVGWSPAKLRLRDAEYDRLRQLMGEDAFQAAYQEGHGLTRLQAVEVALDRSHSGR